MSLLTPLTNTFGCVFLYYYYLVYFFMFSHTDLPDPNDTSSFKLMRFYMWNTVTFFKLWHKPSADLFAGHSTLSHVVVINSFEILPISHSNKFAILIFSYVYQFIFLLLLLVWPIVVLLFLIILSAWNLTYMRSIWYKIMVRDLVSSIEYFASRHTEEDYMELLEVWAQCDEYICGKHTMIPQAYLMTYYPLLNDFKEEYQVINKRVMSERCYKHKLSHPPALEIWEDWDSDNYDGGFCMKPCWGAWSQALFFDAEIHFVDTKEEAMKIIQENREWIAQKKVRCCDELSVMWGGGDRLETFRAYTTFLNGEYKVMAKSTLIFGTIENLSYLNVNLEKNEIGVVFDADTDMCGGNKYAGKDYEWLKQLDAMKQLLVEGHEKLAPHMVCAAWDVGLTSEGPMLIELNIGCDFDLFDMLDQEFATEIRGLMCEWLTPVREMNQNDKKKQL